MNNPGSTGFSRITSRVLLCGAASLALAACDDTGNFNPQNLFDSKPSSEGAISSANQNIEYTEEDVEAPEVFAANEAGLWDGRPSLGGVWVAHPDAEQPERVIIKNETNGQFVVGALFRRENDLPGPRLQLSSDAAKAIGVLAGAPVNLDVVALRKEQKAVEQPAETDVETGEDIPVAAPEEIQEETLDPIAAASAAIDTAPPTNVETQAVEAAASGAAETAAVTSTLPESRLQKPFIQVAAFGVEENANQVGKQMRSIGLIPQIVEQDADGKPLYRVLVGPTMSWNERRKIIKQIKAEGYSDAFAVAN